MSSGLAGLGAIASGISRGLVDAERIKSMRMDNDRQKRLMDDEDKWRRDMEEANASAADWLRGQQQSLAVPGTEPPAGQDGLGGAVMPQAQAQPPSQPMLLKAAQLRTNRLIEKQGFNDRTMKLWLQDEQMRGQLRGSAGERLKMALASGGDPTSAAREFYDLIDDGQDLVSMEPARTDDGNLIYRITTKDAKGRETLSQATPEEIAGMVDMASADPKQTALQSFKTKQKLMEVKAEGEEERRTAKAKSDLRKEADTHTTNENIREEGVRQKNRLGLEAARTAGDLRVKTTPGASSKSEIDARVRLLRERRLSAENEVRGLTNQLKEARSTERAALQQQLKEAQERVRDFGQEIDAYEVELRNSGPKPAAAKPAAAAKALPMPATKDKLKRGQVYDTARGPAKWNGTAFEAQ